MAESITLKYYDGVTQYSRAISVMSVKGFLPYDEGELFPDILNPYLSGIVERQNAGFRRKFSVECGPALLTDTDRLFIANFLVKNQNNIQLQTVTYAYTFNAGTVTESDLGVTLESSAFVSEWLDSIIHGRRFVMRLIEKNLRTSWPSGSTADTTTTVYIKRKVQITSSPLTLTTGSGPLATDQEGNAWPSFTNINKCVVRLQSYQQAQVFKSVEETLSGSNITFQVDYDPAGNPFSDGYYYTDVIIEVRP